MKIIFSRKGFDSQYGGVPSPVFPNGRMYSLPIPYEVASQSRYGAIGIEAGLAGSGMGDVAEQLSRGEVAADSLAHLDPDLDPHALPRLPGWKPAFGQTEAAQGHLDKQGVGVGDVFLFFGWFRRVVSAPSGRWMVDRVAPDQHIVFGYLQIGGIVDVTRRGRGAVLAQRPWLRDHPHVHFPEGFLTGRNVIYIASDRLTLPGVEGLQLPGGGAFRTHHPSRVLTDTAAKSRSNWRLPGWCGPSQGPCLSYHRKPERWTDLGKDVGLRVVDKGQEFVLDCATRPQVSQWLCGLVQSEADETTVGEGPCSAVESDTAI